MNPEFLSILQSPSSGQPLKLIGENQLGTASGELFSIRRGIPVLREKSQLPNRHRFWERVYDLAAPFYDVGVRVGWNLKLGGERIIRQEYIDMIEVNPEDKVLETAVGTGANINLLPQNAAYFGLDLSWQMLARSQRNLGKWNRQAELIQGDAESLPIRDETFDVVYHMGGLQFYDHPAIGIREMSRVAKPGGRIYVFDEASSLKKMVGRISPESEKMRAETHHLIQLVPKNAVNIRTERVCGGELYFLGFEKPR